MGARPVGRRRWVRDPDSGGLVLMPVIEGGSPYYPPIPFALDANAADILAVGLNAIAGGTGQAADAGHRHPGPRVALGVTSRVGPLPSTDNFQLNYASSRLLLLVSGSGIKLNAAGVISLQVLLDGVFYANVEAYSASFGPSEHRAVVPCLGFKDGLAAGAHTITLQVNAGANTGSDANDRYNILLVEVSIA